MTIKYFSSPLCAACWIQKPIIESVVATEDITIEEYDRDFCKEAAAPHYVRGVPSFMVNDQMVYGLQSEEALKEMIE